MQHTDFRKSLDRAFAQAAQKAITPSAAHALFQELRALPLSFETENGCQARAHLMCAYMRDKGITPYKAWVVCKNDRDLRLEVDGPDNKKYKWWFHIATAVLVKMPDRKTEVWVMDPALFDGPATRADWADAMKADSKDVVISHYTKPWRAGRGNFSPDELMPSEEAMRERAISHIQQLKTEQEKISAAKKS